MAPLFVLVHSPVAGLLTWAYVAHALWEREFDVVTPGLHCDRAAWEAGTAYWEQHVSQVVESIRELRSEGPDAADASQPLVLVGHSEAGALLPAIGAALEEALGREVAALVFCDSDLPRDGGSRFERHEPAEEVEAFRRAAVDGMLPPFPQAALEALVPDAAVRAQFSEDLRSTPIEVYEEPLPAPAGWLAKPCAYLGFRHSRASYGASIKEAVERGWPFSELDGAHFHMLVDPARVARALLELTRKCGVELNGPG